MIPESSVKVDMKEFEAGTKHYFSSKLYAKRMVLPKGYSAGTHKHSYDHLSIVAGGLVKVKVNGVESLYSVGDCIEIKAGLVHEIYALEDTVWFCVHGTDAVNLDGIDEVLIQKEGA
jgi:quercetin dioxygenase-like cupin family protein